MNSSGNARAASIRDELVNKKIKLPSRNVVLIL